MKTPQFLPRIPQFTRTLGKGPGPLRTVRARCRAHGSSKPRGRRGPTCSRAALKICCRSRRTFCSQARASQWRPTPARPQVRSPSPAPNLPLGSSGPGRPSSTAHLPTSARCRARAPGPVSGQLYAAAGEGTSHTAALSCCLSAAGIRLLGILSRPGIAPLLRSAYRATIGADPDGVSMFRTHETQLGWAPSIPRGRRCSRDRPGSAVAACRFPAASPCHRGLATRPGELGLTGHHQGFTGIRPSSLPLTCGTSAEPAPLGFP